MVGKQLIVVYVTLERCPVLLVHGWRSNPGIWEPLCIRLEEAGIPCWNFNHADMKGYSPAAIAGALKGYIATMRAATGYSGMIDIVCHSMGTCIPRYLLEVLDGSTQTERVRQLIGIGPPNNGSYLAELFNHPDHGQDIITRLEGIFVPRSYDPAYDIIVQEMRPGSNTIAALRKAGIRRDISYRFILAGNITRTPSFFPWFEGKTWDWSPQQGWGMSWAGDGIVSHSESYLPGADIDILPADPAAFAQHPERYCHLHLPRNPEVIDRVMAYLNNPSPWSEQEGECP
jgi:triacylglycerol lipase